MSIQPDQYRYLIINADDFGYFHCVNAGILEGIRLGKITATGLLANGVYTSDALDKLRSSTALDVGVHLNLTSGLPLTKDMANALNQFDGNFQNPYTMSRLIYLKRIPSEWVQNEWRSQIEKALGFGLEISFLNSHEHIHLLPKLFPLIKALANEFNIPHIRATKPDSISANNPTSLIRKGILLAMGWANGRDFYQNSPHFLGFSASGRLNLKYLSRLLPTLTPGKRHELMCHPGYFDGAEIRDPRLKAYHDWAGELALLTSPEFQALCDKHQVRLINYRELPQIAVQQSQIQ